MKYNPNKMLMRRKRIIVAQNRSKLRHLVLGVDIHGRSDPIPHNRMHQIAFFLFTICTVMTADSFAISPSLFSTSLSKTVLASHHRWLVVDFDGTCTERDTTPLLPKIASLFANDDIETETSRLSTFSELEDEFFALYSSKNNALLSNEAPLTLDETLDILDEVSNTVTQKVSESRVLRGIPSCASRMAALIDGNAQIKDAVRLRPGCVDTLARATDEWGFRMGVLSINWCPTLIDAALLRPLWKELESGEMGPKTGVAETEAFPVWSNTVDLDGVVELIVPGALAKKSRIKALRSCKHPMQSSLIVYIGDSSTDLAALVEADIGILIGNSQSTAALAERCGVRTAPLAERVSGSFDPATIWIAQSWLEIEQLLKEI